jgi:Family of unknown function (DUF6518)
MVREAHPTGTIADMARSVGWIVLIGIGLGVFSVVGDTVSILAAPANAIGPWIVAAYVAGIVARRPGAGAVAGATALVLAVVTYYVGVRLVWGDAFVDPVRATAVWGVVAVLVGAPLGLAGGAWSAGDPRWRVPSVALLSGLLLAEALTRFVEVEGWTGIDFGRTALQVWAYDTVAALFAPILLLERRQLAAGYAASVAVGLAGAALLALTMSLIRGSATGG